MSNFSKHGSWRRCFRTSIDVLSINWEAIIWIWTIPDFLAKANNLIQTEIFHQVFFFLKCILSISFIFLSQDFCDYHCKPGYQNQLYCCTSMTLYLKLSYIMYLLPNNPNKKCSCCKVILFFNTLNFVSQHAHSIAICAQWAFYIQKVI